MSSSLFTDIQTVTVIQLLLGAAAPPLQDRGTMEELLEVHFPALDSYYGVCHILINNQAAELIQTPKLLQRPWTTQTLKNAKSYIFPTFKNTSDTTTTASSAVSNHTKMLRDPKLILF